jgi:hypothetical protein
VTAIAGCGGRQIDVVAHAVQAAGVREGRQLEHPNLLRIASAPASVTLTVPSLPTVTLVAFAGMVIAGCSGLPFAVTSVPCALVWNEPARV